MSDYLRELDHAMRDANRRRVQESVHGPGGPMLTCSDCRCAIHEGAKSTPTGVFCDDDWRWRSARGLEFDPRSKAQLIAVERKGAA